MNSNIKVTIYDDEGNCLLDDTVSSPFVGLQTGEVFWFGPENNRTWAKISKITYGLDTVTKGFVVEIFVEKSEKKETKIASPQTKLIDHGEHTLRSDGGSWVINESDIVVTAGNIYGSKIYKLTLQVNTPTGPIIKSRNDTVPGEFIEVQTNERKVICVLTEVKSSTHSKIRVTESKFI